MRYLAAFFVVLALSGCDRDQIEYGTSSGAADSGAAQTSTPPPSDTLKVTYSKADPYQASKPSTKDSSSGPQGHNMKDMPGKEKKDMPGHDMKKMSAPEAKEKPAQEKKPEHEEHQKK